MKIPQVTIPSENVLLFSDIHWGKSRDLDSKLKITEDFIENFLCKQIVEHDAKDVIFLGDWFDNRNLVSVKTSNCSYNALKKITSLGARVYLIVGNHDSYFKDNIETNSIKQYVEMKNVFPIETLTEVHFTKSDTYALLCPWDSLEPTEVEQGRYDSMFGHFEFQEAQFNGAVSRAGHKPSTLLSIAPKVYSGHYHLRKTYEHKGGTIEAICSPLELDWGDLDNQKGIYIYNVKSNDTSFHENDISPKHYKIFWSKIKNKTEKLKSVSGNYVKLIVDTKYKFDHIIKIINKINSLGPINQCNADFVYNETYNMLQDINVGDNEEIISISKLDYMKRFIDEYFDNKENDTSGLDKAKLITLTENLYNKTEISE